MLNKNAQTNPKSSNSEPTKAHPSVEEMGFQLQQEIDRLEEIILDNPRIPFLGRTLVDEDKLINQLDLIRINIPDSLKQALEILRQKQQIVSEAQHYAQKIIENAQRRAAQILDETGIIQQAEIQANQLQRQIQQECDKLQRQTMSEVEQIRRKVQQEIGQMRQKAMREAEDIQNEADDYADAVLSRLEKHLGDMLKIVHNGRQQLNPKPSSPPSMVNHREDSPVRKKAS
jgi:cell division septum initiation protein DivIVA